MTDLKLAYRIQEFDPDEHIISYKQKILDTAEKIKKKRELDKYKNDLYKNNKGYDAHNKKFYIEII